MKYPLPLLITTILVMVPWDVNGVGFMKWVKKRSEPTDTVSHLGEDRGFESQEKESASSGLAEEKFFTHTIKENRTDSSEASLQENIKAASEEEAFWLRQQEWLIEMEKKFHALPPDHEEREAILKNIEKLIADAREAEEDWADEGKGISPEQFVDAVTNSGTDPFFNALAPNLTNYRTDPFFTKIGSSKALSNWLWKSKESKSIWQVGFHPSTKLWSGSRIFFNQSCKFLIGDGKRFGIKNRANISSN